MDMSELTVYGRSTPAMKQAAHAKAAHAWLKMYAARPAAKFRAGGQPFRRAYELRNAPAGFHYHATKGVRGGAL